MPTQKYPQRLHHKTPDWAPEGAVFHIRIRCKPTSVLLTSPTIAKSLLTSITVYAEQEKWSCFLFLIMPDHVHGLFSFSREVGMSKAVSNWKRFQTTQLGIDWQDNFFDHRIRSQQEFTDKFQYIGLNPVVKGFCGAPDEWPWRTIIAHGLPQF